MVVIDGDAPDGVETMDWYSSAGFTVADAAADAAAHYSYPVDDTGAERAAAAGIELLDLTADELAIIDMGPDEIAQYLKDNDLQIGDVDSVLNSDDQAAVRAEMQATGYGPADTADATELPDLLAAGGDDGVNNTSTRMDSMMQSNLQQTDLKMLIHRRHIILPKLSMKRNRNRNTILTKTVGM